MDKTTEQKWKLNIRGINCQIVFWSTEYMKSQDNLHIYPHKGIWNSYIFIDRKSIPRSFKKLIPPIKKTKYGIKQRFCYEKLPFDMSCGINFFDVISKPDGDIIAIKVGNDYNHIWNQNQFIDETTIKRDLEITVNEIMGLFPSFKVRSAVDGKFVKPEDLEAYNEDARKRLNK